MTVTQPPSMLTPQQLADDFGRNARIIAQQTAGLTHADSLLQPPTRGNCLNWVLGHIAVYRDYILDMLGEEKIVGEAPGARYGRESAPILGDGEGVLPLDTLLAALDQGQGRIAAALARASADDLARDAPTSEPMTVGRRLCMLFWHDSFHTGQTEPLRQLAGTNDQVL